MKSDGRDLKNKYSAYSDEELISMLRDGEAVIEEYILEKYKKLVSSKAKSMYLLGADVEDLIQEGMIGLLTAIRNFDSGRDASFFTFADLCVTRKLYSAISASDCKKHKPLNSYISLYEKMKDENGEASTLALEDTIAPSLDNNPENLLIDRENVESLEKWIEEELSSFESQALDLYLIGCNYGEIARILGRDEKSTDNALNRAKTKIKKHINTTLSERSGK